MSEPEDILSYVEGHALPDRLAWIALLDRACAAAERQRRGFHRKDPARAQTAHAFAEQAKAVLFWLRSGDFPDTRHPEVRPAIAHIVRALGPKA